MARNHKSNLDLENIEIHLLLQGISRHYNFDLHEFAAAPIRRKIWQAIRNEKVGTVSGLQERLLHDSSSMDRFLQSLTKGSPSFPADFYLKFRADVVPMLRTYPFIRIWQAGSASVKDVYSIAIILHEEGLYSKSTIYATDTDEAALQRGQEGIFALSCLREYEEHYRNSGGRAEFSNYYAGGGNSAVFSGALKKNMVFAEHNLATDGSFNEFNTIFCRNALSFYNQPLQTRAHQILYESLGLFGILGLGPRESLRSSPNQNCYAEFDGKHRLYRKIR